MINLNTLIARSFIISFMLIAMLSSNGESNESTVPLTSFSKYYKEFTSINSYYADMNLKVVTRSSSVTPSEYLDNHLEFQNQEQLESQDSKLQVEQDFKEIEIYMQQIVLSLYQEWKDDKTITLIKSFPKPEKTEKTEKMFLSILSLPQKRFLKLFFICCVCFFSFEWISCTVPAVAAMGGANFMNFNQPCPAFKCRQKGDKPAPKK